MNCVSHYCWKPQILEMTHGISQYWHFKKFIILPIYRLPNLLSATKEGFKALWMWCFLCTFGAAPVTQPGTTGIHNREPKYRTFSYLTFLLVFPTSSLHVEMFTYCTSYTHNRTCQIAYKYTGIKICYKTDKFAFEGNKSKVVPELFRLRKVVQLQRILRNAGIILWGFRAR